MSTFAARGAVFPGKRKGHLRRGTAENRKAAAGRTGEYPRDCHRWRGELNGKSFAGCAFVPRHVLHNSPRGAVRRRADLFSAPRQPRPSRCLQAPPDKCVRPVIL